MVKRCAWGTCNSDSRYPERLLTEEGLAVRFHSFPPQKKQNERRQRWILSWRRGDDFVSNFYICSLHFVGKQGQPRIILIQYQPWKGTYVMLTLLFTLCDISQYTCFTIIPRVLYIFIQYSISCNVCSYCYKLKVSRLNRKRKGPLKRTNEGKGFRFDLEKQAMKSLLQLASAVQINSRNSDKEAAELTTMEFQEEETSMMTK